MNTQLLEITSEQEQKFVTTMLKSKISYEKGKPDVCMYLSSWFTLIFYISLM